MSNEIFFILLFPMTTGTPEGVILTKDMSRQIAERIRQAVEDAIERKGVSARRASIDVVGHDGLIRDIRAGRMPSADRLIALMSYLDMMDGTDGHSDDLLPEFAKAAMSNLEPAIDGSPEALRLGYLPIPYCSDDMSHRGAAPIAIARSWIEERSLIAERLCFIAAPDDGMDPTIPPGQLLLLDETASIGSDAQVIAFVHRGQLQVGWVLKPSEGTIVVFFERRYALPLVITGKDVSLFRTIGCLVARFDGTPHPWIGGDQKFDLLRQAKALIGKEA